MSKPTTTYTYGEIAAAIGEYQKNPGRPVEDLQAELAQLKAENERLKANKASTGSSIKIGVKGTICVYGLGRFPVALYASQWKTLLAKAPEIEAFITDNEALLAKKGE